MSTAASAVATVDSATTVEPVATPAVPAFNAADQHTWSREQRAEWNKTGTQPTKADSATATESKDQKDTTNPDSSTGKEKTADSASDSATDKKQKPHIRTPEDTEKRFKEILDENKALQRRLESLERGKPSETRDTKQESQPAAEVKTPPLKKFLEEYFAKPDNKGKAYEDGVEAWQGVRDADAEKRLEQKVRPKG